MADIKAFRALRYDLSKAGDIGELTCAPYDIISEDQRLEYLRQNPYNIIRLELPKGEDPYAQAGETLRSWRKNGILKPDMDPGLYIYEMEFLANVDRGESKKLRCLICRVRLEEFSAGIVLPHEETLSKAKQDRFDLMCAANCNFSSIYSLYQDPEHVTRGRLDNLASGSAPRYEFSDGLVTHRLWVVNDPAAIEAIQEDFAGRKLYIADGHHRYETALNYRRHLKEQGIDCPGSDFVLMTLADMSDDGLVVFPTHRLVRGLEKFDSQQLLKACEEYFDISPVEDSIKAQTSLDYGYIHGKHCFAFYDKEKWYILTLRDAGVMESLLPDKSSAYRELDVSLLHTLVLERLMGIDRENMANQINLTYTRSVEEAARSVVSGESNCCFLLNPTRVEEICSVASCGEKMPQKSTYFYPKLITGFVINDLSQN